MSDTTNNNNTAEEINLLSVENLQNPFPLYARMRTHHPVYQVGPDGLWAVMSISCPTEVKLVWHESIFTRGVQELPVSFN